MFNFAKSSGTKQKITRCDHPDKVWLSLLMLSARYSWWSSRGSMSDGTCTPTSYLSRSRFRFVCRQHAHLTGLPWKSQRLKWTPGGTRNLNGTTVQSSSEGFKTLFSVIRSFVTWRPPFEPWWQKACSGRSWFRTAGATWTTGRLDWVPRNGSPWVWALQALIAMK